MKRLLVVPQRTSHTPDEAFVGPPDLFSKRYDLVEISVIFISDLTNARLIAAQWEHRAKEVRIGGPACWDPGGEFTPGRYVKKGIVYTSRGCVRRCQWCYVPDRERGIRELKIHAGNIVQDNNLLACSRPHVEKVFEMLKSQRTIKFSGGLDARLLKDWHIEALRGLRVFEIWTAADSRASVKITADAVRRLRKAGFSQRKIRCYCMIGFKNETLADAEARLLELYRAGCIPFAQIYDRKPDITKPWRDLCRLWSRPAAIITTQDRGPRARRQNLGPIPDGKAS